jgi:hypothetical protein
VPFAFRHVEHWEFIAHGGSSRMYHWRHLSGDGRILAESDLFADYGRAVSNALSNGFLPKSQHWVNISSNGDVIHFAPGRPPVYIAHASSQWKTFSPFDDRLAAGAPRGRGKRYRARRRGAP